MEVHAESVSGKMGIIEDTTSETENLVPHGPRNASVISIAETALTFVWFAPVER